MKGGKLPSGRSLLVLASLVPLAAMAAPDDDPLDEVVVTARKRAEDIQKVPESVTALGSQALEDAHVTQLDDLGGLVSNLNIVQRNDNTPDVTLRGIGSFGVVQGVGFYSNDVQLFEGQTVRPEDLERIEVLKGPQGTLYGGANIGGAIKYVTKLPTDKLEAEASAEYGDYATQNYYAMLSGPIAGDQLKARVSLHAENNDGWIYDTTHHMDFGATRDRGGRLTLVYQSDKTTIDFFLDGDDFHTGAQNLLYTPPDDHTYLNSVNDWVHPAFVRQLFSPTLKIEHELFDDVTLTSISSYFQSYNKGVTDLCKCDHPFDTLDQNAKNKVGSEELRLGSSGDEPLTWLVGLYAQAHRTDTLQRDNYAPYEVTFSPADLGNPAIVDQALDSQRKYQHEYAAFANASYKLGDWSAEVGIREDYYESRLSDANTQSYHPAAFVYGSESLTGNKVLPKFSLSYQASPEILTYATIAKGFEPADEIYEGFIHRYGAEVATSYEAGIKSTLFGGVHFNAAGFYIDYANRLFQNIQFNNQGIFEVTSNIGDSKNYGFEFDVASKLPFGFRASGSFGLTEAKWGNVPFFDPISNSAINLKGLTAPFTPEYQGNAQLEWVHEIQSDLTFSARVDTAFFGTSYWDPQDAVKQRPYDLLNVGARLEGNNWSIAARIKNVLNTRYNTIYDNMFDVGAPFNVAHLGPPRFFTVTATYKY